MRRVKDFVFQEKKTGIVTTRHLIEYGWSHRLGYVPCFTTQGFFHGGNFIIPRDSARAVLKDEDIFHGNCWAIHNGDNVFRVKATPDGGGMGSRSLPLEQKPKVSLDSLYYHHVNPEGCALDIYPPIDKAVFERRERARRANLWLKVLSSIKSAKVFHSNLLPCGVPQVVVAPDGCPYWQDEYSRRTMSMFRSPGTRWAKFSHGSGLKYFVHHLGKWVAYETPIAGLDVFLNNVGASESEAQIVYEEARGLLIKWK